MLTANVLLFSVVAFGLLLAVDLFTAPACAVPEEREQGSEGAGERPVSGTISRRPA